MRPWRLLVLCPTAVVCAGWAGGVCAAQQEIAAGSVGTPEVRLEVKDGRTQFQIGDRIELELVFRNPSHDAWTLNTTVYGDLSETVTIAPATGWMQWRGPSGHDYSSATALKEAEIRIHVVLNDGFVFREPGHYEVSVTTSRLSRGEFRQQSALGPVTTNTVGIDLTTMPAEQESTLVGSLSAELAGSEGEVREQAAVRLAGLAGDDAVREKVRWLLDDDAQVKNEIGDGLAASHNLELQLSLLEAAWNDVRRTPDSALEGAIGTTRHFLRGSTPLPGWQTGMMPPGPPDAAARIRKRQGSMDGAGVAVELWRTGGRCCVAGAARPADAAVGRPHG
jgi:hypothetical protein